MGLQTIGAILDSTWQITKRAAAFIPQCIERTITEQTIEICRIYALMTGKILTFPILKKLVIGHITPLSKGIPEEAHG